MKSEAIRPPAVAGQFYEGSRAALERAVAKCVAGYRPPVDLAEVLGGVVPHAGWMFSGPTAAKVFVTLAEKLRPETYVLFGAVHHGGVRAPAVYPGEAWSTPLGDARVDQSLASAIVEAGRGALMASTSAHQEEHSIEVQVPFIQALSPEACIVPIAVPPGSDAPRIGEIVAQVVREAKKRVALVASTDLTHYGMGYGVPDQGPLPDAMPWMRENDQRIIRLIEKFRAEDIVPEAEERHNACGAGAIAAVTAAARGLDAASARVLEYTTSADVMQERYADRAVGYLGLVFEKARAT